MISGEAIKRLAVSWQTAELNVAREYAQHLFLSGFYRQSGTQRVMFKGGTALRIVYGSPRFSEDLDFSGFGVGVKDIEDWVTNASEGIERAGISISIEESKKTSGGYLDTQRHDSSAAEASASRGKNGVGGVADQLQSRVKRFSAANIPADHP